MIWTRSNSGIDPPGRLRRGRGALACVLAGELALAGLGLAGLAACTPEPPATALDATASAVPKAAPRTVGLQRTGNGDERSLIAAFGGTYADAKAEALLDGVAVRLVAASTEPSISYKITVLN